MEEGSSPLDDAREWLEQHADEVPGASLPQDHYRDPKTGETLEEEKSDWLGGTFDRSDFHGPRHGRVLSYSTSPGLAEAGRALVGRGPRDRGELDIRVRVDRAFSELREDQQELLRLRFFEQLTLEEIAVETGTRKQSVHDRLNTATQDLCVAIARTWNLPYDIADELFGIRPEGRPTRDREGEQLAAELAITGFFASRKEADDD